ncbi:MAG: Franean1_4349 family RiPP [Nitrospinae bacterium]|nr:Franean1_4349 family RiPP [Nitrospinota bacterium]
MSQESVEHFLGRIITDEEFRLRAKDSLNRAAVDLGFSFTSREIAALASLDVEELEGVARQLDKSIRRSGSIYHEDKRMTSSV